MKHNCKLIFEDEFVYLPLYYNMEVISASKLSELMALKKSYSSNIAEEIFKYSKLNGIELSLMQEEAVKKALNRE